MSKTMCSRLRVRWELNFLLFHVACTIILVQLAAKAAREVPEGWAGLALPGGVAWCRVGGTSRARCAELFAHRSRSLIIK